jgi:hypothetical protein
MKQLITCAIALGLVVLTSVAQTTAHPPFEVPLRVIVGVSTNTMYFGILPGADRCLNPADCFNGHCESELPPLPPGGVFDMRFALCGGWGTAIDFRPLLGAAQRDTFTIRIQQGTGIDTVILRWPAGLSAYFTALTLRYFDGSGIVNIDMLRDTSANLTEASAPTIYSGGLVVSAEQTLSGVPERIELNQNYPNPFNPTTAISYQLTANSFVVLKVYDVLGREVATLVNEVKPPGNYTVQWDASSAASGVYFYKLNAGDFTSVRKLLLLR